MTVLLDGWSNWTIAFFRKLQFGNIEITIDRPARIRYPRQGYAATVRTLAGTTIHQPFWLGGDAPINLKPISPIEMDFEPGFESEAKQLAQQSDLCAFSPQAMFAGIWIHDIWYIPAAPDAQTDWQLSRSFPFDIVDINDATNDYLPKVEIDGTAQTIVQTGTPSAGQVLITPDVESHIITLPAKSTLSGTFLKLFYPPKIYICQTDINEEIPDNDVYTMGLSMEEHLPNRLYNFAVA
jgi:hypothetical protein